jgi:sugar/nucleoside kinase (ribokinase family)
MTVDVVCAAPPFLDIVFRGLERIPQSGEEVLASAVSVVPGAMANVAFALRQLKLDAVVCSRIGTDPAGRLLQELMANAGIPWIGEPTGSTSLSVALPVEGDRAFVTVQSETAIDLDAIAALSPRAVVVNLPMAGPMPGTPWIYAVVGDPQVAILREQGLGSLGELRTLFPHAREAPDLPGLSDIRQAAAEVAAHGGLVIVTRGSSGAVAAIPDGRVVEAPGIVVDAQDTVGAGDLFAAAFIWADLLGRPLDETLNLAIAYASQSLAHPVPGQKGLGVAAFRDVLAATAAPLDWLQEV